MLRATNRPARKFTGIIGISVGGWILLLIAVTFAQSPSTFNQDFSL